MHLLSRAAQAILFGGVVLGAPAQAARQSPACAGLAQKAATFPADDVFQSNLLLFAAATAGCDDLIRGLLERGVALDARDRLGRTALALAAKAGRALAAELLIEKGAAIDARAISGATPLFFASEADHSSIAKYLIAHGADVNLAGSGGLTPLMAAAFNGNLELLDLLLAKGADPNALDASGKAAIVYAASRGFARVVARLIEAGVDVNRKYDHGLTALMWAAGYADGAGIDDIKQVLALLIARGAALEGRDDRGKSAIEIARDLGHSDIADFLSAQKPAR
ncbi:MAG: ankyrin repeat domain-containing protein [Methylobacteriaceae bacterium]|nr:ankyrin repeat domain-containing protein [Methylobacteriaceae bacterium]